MSHAPALPPLVIPAEDYVRLAYVATASMMARRRPPAGAVLADELVRACVVPSTDVPPSVVTISTAGWHEPPSSIRATKIPISGFCPC